MIYLDNAATTFPKPEEVYRAIEEIQRKNAVNAGRGTYTVARTAENIITSVRNKLAELTGCFYSDSVVISPSATIAMNQIINGISWHKDSKVYITPFEHNAVVRTIRHMADTYGFEIIMLPFDSITHEIDEQKMINMFAFKHPDAVFVNHISNVTGTILPVKKIFSTAKKYNAITVLDASQSLGLLECDIRKISVDFIVFAGHKNLYGHIGAGGFICGGNVKLNAFITGGTGSDSLNTDMPDDYPARYEAGSHNILSIASLDASLDWIMSTGIDNIYLHKKELTDYAIEKLGKLNGINMYLPENRRNHIAVVSFTHNEYLPNELADILDIDFDIAVRSGYHCAPYVHRLIGTEKCGGTVRVSIG
ncbi:MAG: aminotransferase class V-fold PLP-dependent enzyme, partial [Ruminococcus sp.]|nr:aminotransferase class V-fold PLP-dependent enzyme [Ruminococcus sp.]